MTETHYTLVDVCWTLFRSNTTFDFLDFAIKDKRYIRLRRFGRKRLVQLANLLLYKLFRYDWLRSHCLRYLAGKSRSKLQALAEQFYQEKLLPRRIGQIWEQLPRTNVIIVSGTLDIIAQTVAAHIGAEMYYATEMLYTDDIFTGRYKDLLLLKSSVLTRYTDYDIITDNLTDIDLVRHARHATILVYNNRNRWLNQLPSTENITFIESTEQRY